MIPAPVEANLSEADYIIAHSFGTSIGPGSPNYDLGQMIVDLKDGRPVIADRTLVNAIWNGGGLVEHPVDGDITNHRGQGLGTIGVLRAAKIIAFHENLKLPIQLAQNNHIDRVLRQAALIGLPDAVIPADLPKQFDTHSKQVWTRNKFLWTVFNGIGSVYLKSKGEL